MDYDMKWKVFLRSLSIKLMSAIGMGSKNADMTYRVTWDQTSFPWSVQNLEVTATPAHLTQLPAYLNDANAKDILHDAKYLVTIHPTYCFDLVVDHQNLLSPDFCELLECCDSPGPLLHIQATARGQGQLQYRGTITSFSLKGDPCTKCCVRQLYDRLARPTGDAVDSSCNFLGKHTDSSTCFMVGDDLSMRVRFGIADTQVAQGPEVSNEGVIGNVLDAVEQGRGDGKGDGNQLVSALHGMSIAQPNQPAPHKATDVYEISSESDSDLQLQRPKQREVSMAIQLKPRAIKDAVELLTTIFETGDWQNVIIEEYPDPSSKVTKAVKTILLASLRGTPVYSKDQNPEAGPFSAIIAVIPNLVDPHADAPDAPDAPEAFTQLLREITGEDIEVRTHVREMYAKIINSLDLRKEHTLHFWRHSLTLQPSTNTVYINTLLQYLRGDMNDLETVPLDAD